MQIAEPDINADRRFPDQQALSAPDGRRPRTPWPALVTLLAGAGVLDLVLWDGPSVLRAVSVLTYIAMAPGLACARLIRIPDGLSRFVVGVALSLALGVLVAQGMIHLHRWSPLLGLSTLIAIASLAALTELVRDGLGQRWGRGGSAE